MARGRMLNKKIGLDKRVAELEEQIGLEAVLIFTWLIPHLDVNGRMNAELRMVRNLVFPRLRKITVEMVGETLRVAHEIGLITLYEAQGDQWLQFKNFHKNQPGLRRDREPEPDCPPPPESDNDPESIRQSSGSHPEEIPVKRREEKRREEKQKRNEVNPTMWDGYLHLLAVYRSLGHPRMFKRPKQSAREFSRYKARLAEGWEPSELETAVRGCHLTPWNAGKDPKTNGRKYLGLDLILRNSSNVERFIGNFREYSPEPDPDDREAESRRVIDEISDEAAHFGLGRPPPYVASCLVDTGCTKEIAAKYFRKNGNASTWAGLTRELRNGAGKQ